MAKPPDKPHDAEEGTVILPAGQSSGGAERQGGDPWPDDEATEVVQAPPQGDAWSDKQGHGDLTAGRVLGNYKVGRLIARGGLGAIYDGVNIHNPAERVAIKTILPAPGSAERVGKLLLDEANALMRVRHDAVVPYRTYGRIEDTNEFYLVLEFIDGDALNDFYRRRKLTEKELFNLGRRLAAGLQASHEEGLVHRDVSPDNVLLQHNRLEDAILVDFGIAKLGDIEELPDTQFAGKLSYAAPEQFEHGGRIGPWTDVYSLALLLVAAARGQALPMGKTIEEAQEARRTVPDLSGVPPLIEPILRKMLEPHPADRPQSMREVVRLFDSTERAARRAQNATQPGAAGSSAGITRAARSEQPKKRRAGGGGWITILAALVVGGGGAGVAMLYGDQLLGDGGNGPIIESPPDPKPPDPLPPEPAPPEASRAYQLANLVQAYRTALDKVECSAVRVAGRDTGTAFAIDIGGVWPEGAGLRRAAEAIERPAGTALNVKGETFDRALCPVVDALKPAAVRLGEPRLTRPQPTGRPDRSVTMRLTAEATTPFIYLLEADGSGTISSLADLSSQAARDRLAAEGRLAESGNRYDLTFIPATPDSNVTPSMLIAVRSASALPAAVSAPASAPLAAWVAAVTTAPGNAALDIVPRDGVPAAEPDTPPVVESDRAALLTAAEATVHERLSAVSCSLVRIRAGDGGPPFAFTVGGVWGNAAAMEAAAADAAAASQSTVTLAGRTIDPGLCAPLDALRKAVPGAGPELFEAVQPTGLPDRSSYLTLKQPEGALVVYEADAGGGVSAILDLSNPGARTAALEAGRLEDLGGGRLRARLTPAGPAANAVPTLLIALESANPAAPIPPGTLDAWLAETARLPPGSFAVDAMERPAVAPAPIPEPAPPVAGIDAATREAFAAVDCSLIRLSGDSSSGIRITGSWGKEDAVSAAAAAASSATGASYTLAGSRLAPRHCGEVNELKAFFVADSPPSIATPVPGGGAGNSVVDLRRDPAYAAFYLVWIDAVGTARSLIDFNDAASRERFQKLGALQEKGDGSYRVVLPPYSAEPGAASGLLVAVHATSALPADAFGFRALNLREWKKRLTPAAAAGPLRIDLVEYTQAAAN